MVKQGIIIYNDETMSLHVNFVFFAVVSCSVERSRPNRFHSLYSCLFLCVCVFFLSGRSCSRILLGLTLTVVNEILINIVVIISCRSGYILMEAHGCLSLTGVPMKIGIGSGNEEK